MEVSEKYKPGYRVLSKKDHYYIGWMGTQESFEAYNKSLAEQKATELNAAELEAAKLTQDEPTNTFTVVEIVHNKPHYVKTEQGIWDNKEGAYVTFARAVTDTL